MLHLAVRCTILHDSLQCLRENYHLPPSAFLRSCASQLADYGTERKGSDTTPVFFSCEAGVMHTGKVWLSLSYKVLAPADRLPEK
jgi:hypothetical protein